MALLLPLDDDGRPMPILGFRFRGCQKIPLTGTSARNATPIDPATRVVTIATTGNCRFEVGDAGVTADAVQSAFLLANSYVDIPLTPTERHVAFIADGGGSGDAYIIERNFPAA
jgi:hypothetical protein